MAFAYLDDGALRELRAAAMALGFNSDGMLDALAAGINRAFVGSAMAGPTPNAKLVTMTARMNATRALTSGEIPLRVWLANAIQLAGGAPEEQVFRDALARISVDAPDPAQVKPPDVDDTPRKAGGQLEIAIDEDDTLGVGFLLQGAAAAASVAKLSVHRHFDGQPSFAAGGKPDLGLGTGWLIAPRLVITNHHVVAARAVTEAKVKDSDFELQGRNVQVTFGLFEDGSPVVTVPSTACLLSSTTLDYALLRIGAAKPARVALRLRTNPLTHSKDSGLRDRVNVLQHPDGHPMRLGFRNNFVVSGTAERLSYLTDTAGGSSGSPICDDLWFVAGLHRGWSPIKGDPVEVWGKQIRQENYGTPIGLILDDIATRNPALRKEIDKGQSG